MRDDDEESREHLPVDLPDEDNLSDDPEDDPDMPVGALPTAETIDPSYNERKRNALR